MWIHPSCNRRIRAGVESSKRRSSLTSVNTAVTRDYHLPLGGAESKFAPYGTRRDAVIADLIAVLSGRCEFVL